MHPLTAFCKRHDVPLYRLAERMGVSNGNLYRMVRFMRRPSPDMIVRIESATGGEVTAAALLQAHFLPERQNVGQADNDPGGGPAVAGADA